MATTWEGIGISLTAFSRGTGKGRAYHITTDEGQLTLTGEQLLALLALVGDATLAGDQGLAALRAEVLALADGAHAPHCHPSPDPPHRCICGVLPADDASPSAARAVPPPTTWRCHACDTWNGHSTWCPNRGPLPRAVLVTDMAASPSVPLRLRGVDRLEVRAGVAFHHCSAVGCRTESTQVVAFEPRDPFCARADREPETAPPCAICGCSLCPGHRIDEDGPRPWPGQRRHAWFCDDHAQHVQEMAESLNLRVVVHLGRDW